MRGKIGKLAEMTVEENEKTVPASLITSPSMSSPFAWRPD
jgi:hypothetical protein